MSQSPKVTPEFLSRQLDRVLTGLGAIEDQITVLTGMAAPTTAHSTASQLSSAVWCRQ